MGRIVISSSVLFVQRLLHLISIACSSCKRNLPYEATNTVVALCYTVIVFLGGLRPLYNVQGTLLVHAMMMGGTVVALLQWTTVELVQQIRMSDGFLPLRGIVGLSPFLPRLASALAILLCVLLVYAPSPWTRYYLLLSSVTLGFPNFRGFSMSNLCLNRLLSHPYRSHRRLLRSFQEFRPLTKCFGYFHRLVRASLSQYTWTNVICNSLPCNHLNLISPIGHFCRLGKDGGGPFLWLLWYIFKCTRGGFSSAQSALPVSPLPLDFLRCRWLLCGLQWFIWTSIFKCGHFLLFGCQWSLWQRTAVGILPIRFMGSLDAYG